MCNLRFAMCVTCTKIDVKKTPCDDYGKYTNEPGNKAKHVPIDSSEWSNVHTAGSVVNFTCSIIRTYCPM